jgi:REP element-mobilizing transposase RayT
MASMTYDIFRRRNSLRDPGYDYAQPGAVFVTICTSGRQPLFGTMQSSHLVHTPAGATAVDRWRAIPDRFPTVAIDAFVVMPDHVHSILICGTVPNDETPKATTGDVVRWFKSSVHAAYRHGVMRLDWPAYDCHLWHRAYYDRIIRTAGEYAQYQRYIDGNPGRWWERHHPHDTGPPG